MSFWSSQRLEGSLHRLVGHTRKDSVDCNAITMRIGGEIYITPGLEQTAPNSHTKQLLGPTQPIAIPPGRFAFLLTEEVVTIPPEVMGFISMKATFKSKGLVNVSGFHVDPGWNGPLIFAVFNAGPATVHLQRGMPLFLLWIADLEEASKKRKDKPGPTGIPPEMINNITGVVDSIYALENRLKDDLKELREKDDSLRDQVTEVKERQTRILLGLSIAAVIGSALVGVALKSIADYFTRPSIPMETTGPLLRAQKGHHARSPVPLTREQRPSLRLHRHFRPQYRAHHRRKSLRPEHKPLRLTRRRLRGHLNNAA